MKICFLVFLITIVSTVILAGDREEETVVDGTTIGAPASPLNLHTSLPPGMVTVMPLSAWQKFQSLQEEIEFCGSATCALAYKSYSATATFVGHERILVTSAVALLNLEEKKLIAPDEICYRQYTKNGNNKWITGVATIDIDENFDQSLDELLHPAPTPAAGYTSSFGNNIAILVTKHPSKENCFLGYDKTKTTPTDNLTLYGTFANHERKQFVLLQQGKIGGYHTGDNNLSPLKQGEPLPSTDAFLAHFGGLSSPTVFPEEAPVGAPIVHRKSFHGVVMINQAYNRALVVSPHLKETSFAERLETIT